MRNYIEFKYDNNGFMYGKVCKEGTYKYVKRTKNVDKLIELVESYGYSVNNPIKVVRYSRDIIKKYEQYIKEQNRHYKRKHLKVNRTNKGLGQRIAAISLAGIMVGSGIIVNEYFKNLNKEKDENTIVYGQYIDEDDSPNEIDIIDEESIEYNDNTDEQITKPTVKEEVKKEKKNNKEKKEKKKDEVNEMVSDEGFHFSYEDRTENGNMEVVNQYDDIFQKYADMYGVDADLLKAMASQETGGDHYGHIDNGPAEGIMQIEKDVHIGETVTAYNIQTKEIDSFDITSDNLQDLDFNIRVAAMILRNAMESFNYNIPQGTQAYNLGTGDMNKALAECSRNLGITQSELENTPTNNNWLDYRAFLDSGDPEYIEHVFSYLPNNKVLSVIDRDGNTHTIHIINDYTNTKSK